MLAMEVRASSFCARETRGTSARFLTPHQKGNRCGMCGVWSLEFGGRGVLSAFSASRVLSGTAAGAQHRGGGLRQGREELLGAVHVPEAHHPGKAYFEWLSFGNRD